MADGITSFKELPAVTRAEQSHPATYTLQHTSSGMFYVGSTGDLYSRVRKHGNDLNAQRHKNKPLQNAFNQDTEFTLTFVKTDTPEQATEIEQKMLDRFMPHGCLFNASGDAKVPGKGIVRTEEECARISEFTIQQFTDPKAREMQREISNRLWQDPDYRARQRAGMAEINPEIRKANARKAAQALWVQPGAGAFLNKVHEGNCKPIEINGVRYESRRIAQEALNISDNTLRKRLKEGYKNESYKVLPKEEVKGNAT